MTRDAGGGWLESVRGLAKRLFAGPAAGQEQPAQASSQAGVDEIPCCEGQVHIAYRGVSDDRMYIVYQRKWSEVRYFRQNGLRVFCAGCRRRLV